MAVALAILMSGIVSLVLALSPWVFDKLQRRESAIPVLMDCNDNLAREGQAMRLRDTLVALWSCAFIVVMSGPEALAEEPFYKGKRLIVLINFGVGGPADIEARLFAR